MNVSLIKLVSYMLFALCFFVFKIFPVRSNKVVFIMTHESDEKGTGNIARVYQRLRHQNHELHCHFITRKDYKISALPRLFLVKSFHLATTRYVFLDNVFLPAAFMKFKKTVKVVQLWHGTGTIKKFGQDVNRGLLYFLERRANKTYTHLIVNSKKVGDVYARAFNIPMDRIYAVGSPRTDLFFDKGEMAEMMDRFFGEFPFLKEKKLILYAPTFREHDYSSIGLDLDYMIRHLGKDFVILVKLHPWLSDKVIEIKQNDRICDFSKYPDINVLLLVSDLLITDYSSLIFEYALLRRPIIFFPYDLHQYQTTERGFYEDYASFVPGKIAMSNEELLEMVGHWTGEYKTIEDFIMRHYDYLDGKSTDRVIKLIFE